jgi:hypothetical protein
MRRRCSGFRILGFALTISGLALVVSWLSSPAGAQAAPPPSVPTSTAAPSPTDVTVPPPPTTQVVCQQLPGRVVTPNPDGSCPTFKPCPVDGDIVTYVPTAQACPANDGGLPPCQTSLNNQPAGSPTPCQGPNGRTPLAFTGSRSLRLLLIATAFVIVGTALLASGRRLGRNRW